MISHNPSAAPLTITLPPNLAASVRFLAHVYGHSPESLALHAITERISGATVDTAGARRLLRYRSAKRFWEAVRREQIPFSRLSARHCVFQVADLRAVLESAAKEVRHD